MKMKKNISVLVVCILLSTTLYGQTPILVNSGSGGVQIWSAPPPGYEEGIHLTNNVKLTISGNTWSFNSNAKIVVDAGCQLIIDNSAILTDNNNDNKWLGIEANGDYSKDQFTPGGKPNNNIKNGSAGASAAWEGSLEPSQAQVFIKAGCYVINAECGVRANLGAIVRATGAIFLDNQVGIHVFKYKSFGHPEMNASYMMDCKFIWNTINPNFNNSELKGIHLQVVRGINIGGCEFTNNFSSRNDYRERSVGILCDYSTMHASKSGNLWCDDDDGCPDNCYNGTSTNNSFNKLFRGFYITTSRYLPVAIRNSNFTNCKSGIEMVNGWGCIITKCLFTANSAAMDANFTNWSSLNVELKHINSDNCISSTIYDNDFYYDAANVWSINVDDIGHDRSKIRKNRITNTTNNATYFFNIYGLKINGDCTGLEVDCNTFVSQGVDIYISSGASCYSPMVSDVAILSPDGIGLLNNFSSFRQNRYRVLIGLGSGPGYIHNHVKYFYHTSASSNQKPSIIPPFTDPYSEALDIQNLNNSGICDLTCSQLSKIDKYSIIKSIKVYPNPSFDGKFNIEFSNLKNVNSISIYNSIGQLINDYIVEPNQTDYSFEIQSKGIYFLQVKDMYNNSSTEKLICK
jgi:hypothetical protein